MSRSASLYSWLALSVALGLVAVLPGTAHSQASRGHQHAEYSSSIAVSGVDLCADFIPPGCVQSGCSQEQVCDTTVGCNPSACECDPATGQVICTADCGGGTCVPAPPPTCCDPAEEPGTGGNPFCIEGASCCADGNWSCNDAGGNSTCDAPSEACTACCDPAEEPGAGGNPICFEGHSCCADGSWACNGASGSTTCDVLGILCEVDLCADFTPPGCVQTGCLEEQVCDTTVGCNPSFCSCDPATGQVICTADCGGGTCVPAPPPTCCDPADEPGTGDNPFCIEGASCCADGSWSCNDAGGSSTCDAPSEACTGCCDPAEEPGAGGNPICFEGHSCCADGIWQCNAANGSTTCDVLGILCEVDLCADFTPPGCVQTGCLEGQVCDTNVGCNPSACECDPATGQVICTADCNGGTCVPAPPPTCCDPANEPGTGGNPFCFEGASCCADGNWSCNDAGGNSTCDAPSEACTACCDPAAEPGTDGNPICFEGHSCCADGIWQCNAAAGNTTCNALGIVCEADLCAGFTPPGCVQTGCLEGQVCDTNLGCVPSFCSCDPDTGQVICTDDCGGGTCVPEPSTTLLGASALLTLVLLRRRSGRSSST